MASESFDDQSTQEGGETEELSLSNRAVFENIEDLRKQNDVLEDIRRATFNMLEDVSNSEEQLQKKTEELEKFQQAVDASFDHIIITDPDGRVLYANHAAEIMTGYAREEMVGATPALWGRQMPTAFYETMWRTIKTEKNRYAGELTNKRKDGTKYLASLRVTPILNKHNEVKFFVGIERDVTEERQFQVKIVRHAAELEQANRVIAQEKERAEDILRFLRSIGEGVVATDTNGRIIFMNETAETMSGQAWELAKDRVMRDTVVLVAKKHDAERSLDIADTVLRERHTITFPQDTFLKTRDGEIAVSGTCSLIRDAQHAVAGTITAFQDITKRHALEQMKNSFLSIAAHQLRTPLGGMRWSMELLLDGDLGKLPKGAKEAVRQMYDNSQRMILLVDDLLNVARIDEDRGREEKSFVDVGQVLTDVVNAMRPEADRRRVTLFLRKGRETLPAIMAPAKHFYEAMENLLSNSIKYNRPAGAVTVTVQKTATSIVIAVADTGIGIAPEHHSKIFSKFFRAPNAILKETEGSGLGLSVVKSYLEEAGAAIRFESQENVGTTFFIEIPIDDRRLFDASKSAR